MSEWISVNGRMPEPGKEVLGALISSTGRCIIRTVEHVKSEDHDWESDGFEVAYIWTVTHWMPLPPPPEQESE